jgi:hypothetical protein
VLLAELGRREEANRRFAEAQLHFADDSPFPLAWLRFQEKRHRAARMALNRKQRGPRRAA